MHKLISSVPEIVAPIEIEPSVEPALNTKDDLNVIESNN
jgi:hypothetical protein